MSVPNTTFRSFVEKLGGTDASEFVGDEGDLFWKPEDASLRISDGTTPGGVAVTAAGINTSFVAANGTTFEIKDGLIIGMS